MSAKSKNLPIRVLKIWFNVVIVLGGAANGRILRQSGYIFLIMAALWPVADFALSSYVLSRIDVTNLDIRPAITLDKDAFVVGLLFLVFGAILTRGHELQEHEQALEEEQAFTI